MTPMTIAYLATAGGTSLLSLYNKSKENDKADRELSNLNEYYYNQSLLSDRQFFLGKAQVKSQMISETASATAQSMDAAVQSYQAKSQASAQAAASGIGEGTVYSNVKLLSDMLQNRTDLMNQSTQAALNATAIGGEVNALQMQQRELDLQRSRWQLDEAQNELEWNKSIWSFALTGISGALNGASTMASIDTMGQKVFGPDFLRGGQAPIQPVINTQPKIQNEPMNVITPPPQKPTGTIWDYSIPLSGYPEELYNKNNFDPFEIKKQGSGYFNYGGFFS